jgi:hypothetical protein
MSCTPHLFFIIYIQIFKMSVKNRRIQILEEIQKLTLELLTIENKIKKNKPKRKIIQTKSTNNYNSNKNGQFSFGTYKTTKKKEKPRRQVRGIQKTPERILPSTRGFRSELSDTSFDFDFSDTEFNVSDFL